MILTALISIITAFINILISALPDSQGFPPEVTTAFTNMFGYINTASFLLPVDQMFSAILVSTAIYNYSLAFKIFNWVISKIPFVGR